MAKKIKVNEVKRASNALKDFHIEHCLVEYPNNSFIVVKNVNKENAVTAIEAAGLKVHHIKNVRHYESICFKHIKGYYEYKS